MATNNKRFVIRNGCLSCDKFIITTEDNPGYSDLWPFRFNDNSTFCSSLEDASTTSFNPSTGALKANCFFEHGAASGLTNAVTISSFIPTFSRSLVSGIYTFSGITNISNTIFIDDEGNYLPLRINISSNM